MLLLGHTRRADPVCIFLTNWKYTFAKPVSRGPTCACSCSGWQDLYMDFAAKQLEKYGWKQGGKTNCLGCLSEDVDHSAILRGADCETTQYV